MKRCWMSPKKKGLVLVALEVPVITKGEMIDPQFKSDISDATDGIFVKVTKDIDKIVSTLEKTLADARKKRESNRT